MIPPPAAAGKSAWECQASEGGTRACTGHHCWPVYPNTEQMPHCHGAGWTLEMKSLDGINQTGLLMLRYGTAFARLYISPNTSKQNSPA